MTPQPDMIGDGIFRSAKFSASRKYRYVLQRDGLLDPHDSEMGRGIVFIMLNPSIADAFGDDPTVKRCMVRSARNAFNRIRVVNLFALVSTDPKLIEVDDDPVGPENNVAIVAAATWADKIIVAWGTKARRGKFADRSARVLGLLREFDLYCIDVSKVNGEPVHPLYQPYDKPFRPFVYEERKK